MLIRCVVLELFRFRCHLASCVIWGSDSLSVPFNRKSLKLKALHAHTLSFFPPRPITKLPSSAVRFEFPLQKRKRNARPIWNSTFQFIPHPWTFRFLYFSGYKPESDKHAMPILHPSAIAHWSLVLVSVFNLRPFNHSNVHVAPFTHSTYIFTWLIVQSMHKYLSFSGDIKKISN